MTRLRVLTPWTGAGVRRDRRRPTVVDDHPLLAAGSSWVDVTGQPASALIPTPNLFTVEIVCDDATAAAIAADSNYAVLWSEPA